MHQLQNYRYAIYLIWTEYGYKIFRHRLKIKNSRKDMQRCICIIMNARMYIRVEMGTGSREEGVIRHPPLLHESAREQVDRYARGARPRLSLFPEK